MRGKFIKLLFLVTIFCFMYYLPKIAKAADDNTANTKVLISEVCYNPIQAGNDAKYEWVELYNNSNEPFDLSNWSLLDNTDSVVISKKSYILEPNTFLVVAAYRESFLINYPDIGQETKIVYLDHAIGNGLSNSDDTLSLLDGDGVKVDSVSWNAIDHKELVVADGQSIERVSVTGEFIKNLKPSPGIVLSPIVESNDALSVNETLDIIAVRDIKDGGKITVSGVVTVLPGVLSSQYFYIQDKTGGIQVYNYHKIFPVLKLGDSISVSGELSTISGERRIKIAKDTDIKVFENIAEIIPERVKISEIGEQYEGEYIKTTGLVVETNGNNFIIKEKDSDKQIKVIIRDSAKIDKPRMKKGDEVEIAGIISEYKGEYRILPTKQEDVKVFTSSYLPVAGPSELLSLFFGIIIYISWILFQKVRRRRSILAADWHPI